MRRRTFLATSTAAVLSGCAAAPLPRMPSSEIKVRWPPLGRIVDVDGLDIHAWDQGTGQPVIMIHGASGNLRDFSFSIAPRLAASYRAIAFDRPGLGYSQRPADAGGDPAVQARILMAAARQMGVERPILVGHSMGAAVAMAWALADPGGIAGIVSVSGAVMPWAPKPMLAEMVGLDELLIGVYLDYLEASAGNGGIERFVERIFRPQEVPEGYLEYVGGPLSLRPETLDANKQDIAALNTGLRRMAPDYGRVRVPVEVISGSADFIIEPEEQPMPFAAQLQNARLTILDGVGHMAHHANAEVLDAAIARVARAAATA